MPTAALKKVKTEAIDLSNFLEEDMPRIQTMTRRGWMEEGRVDGSSRAVLMKEAEKLRAPAMENWRYP